MSEIDINCSYYKDVIKKEIIIDGIDVSECEYLNKVVNEEPYCNINEEHLYTCSSDENCYYKQLKRLQEENENLKKELEIALKEEARWKSNFNSYKHINREQHTLIEEYKQALEEIREIYKLTCRDCEYALSCEIENCGYYKLIMIKKTVNEVLNDRD